jgi:hypothetical protein
MGGVLALDGKGRLGMVPQLALAMGILAIGRHSPRNIEHICASEFCQDRSFLVQQVDGHVGIGKYK